MPRRRGQPRSSDVPDRSASAITKWPACSPSTASATTTSPASPDRMPGSRFASLRCDEVGAADENRPAANDAGDAFSRRFDYLFGDRAGHPARAPLRRCAIGCFDA